MKVVVLSGGDSPERDISLRSGTAVKDALTAVGHKVVHYDPSNGYDGLASAARRADMVFPILHGANGEDGKVQRQLEMLGIPYLGTDSRACLTCIDKVRTHEILARHGIAMPEFAVVGMEDARHPLFTEPFVLKPICGGSSLDTLIVREVTPESFEAVKTLLEKNEQMIVEELVFGDELTVGVLDDKALPPILIVPPKGGEFTYDNKYNGLSEEICPIPNSLLPSKTQKRAEDLALQVHGILSCRHLSRTDIIHTKDDELYVLELNTMPGLTAESLFPLCARKFGLSMEQLVEKFISLTMEKK